jgi:hypothetical protein
VCCTTPGSRRDGERQARPGWACASSELHGPSPAAREVHRRSGAATHVPEWPAGAAAQDQDHPPVSMRRPGTPAGAGPGPSAAARAPATTRSRRPPTEGTTDGGPGIGAARIHRLGGSFAPAQVACNHRPSDVSHGPSPPTLPAVQVGLRPGSHGSWGQRPRGSGASSGRPRTSARRGLCNGSLL